MLLFSVYLPGNVTSETHPTSPQQVKLQALIIKLVGLVVGGRGAPFFMGSQEEVWMGLAHACAQWVSPL